jgi:hypothetical protein
MTGHPAPTASPRPTLHWLVWLTLAFFALAASGAAWADPPGRVGRIASTDGTVWLFDTDDGEWVQAYRNQPLTEGDRISAERGARAELQIGSATLRLDGGTELEFAQLDDERVRVRLHGGTLALRTLNGDSARDFVVLTDEGRYEPLRAGRYRIDARNDGSFGAALSGALRFEASDSVLDINAGQRAEFWIERGVTHYAWSQLPDDRFSEWVARQDREDDRDRERNRYVSPEMTGSEDLDRYGRWDRHPDYGPVWYPSSISVGWAPYRYGRWTYVRPWGWTWVDDAPWGFAPFHYGRWVSWNGRWGWCPGHYVARPVYAPALVAWFGGSNVSVGISIGGPAVGWVPLAPREVYYPTYQVTNVYVRNVNVTHRNWHGPNPRYERTVPTGPIMYTNQGVAGGVTVVPQAVMRERKPVSSAAVAVDNRTVSTWQSQANASRQAVVPVAPPTPRVVATPGGAVPAAPGSTRTSSWTAPGRGNAARSDGGEADRPGRGQGRSAPQAQATPAVPATPQVAPAVPATPAIPAAPQRVQPPQRGRGDDAREAAPQRGRSDEAREAQPQRGRSDEAREAAPRREPRAAVQPPQQPVPPARPAPPTQSRADNNDNGAQGRGAQGHPQGPPQQGKREPKPEREDRDDQRGGRRGNDQQQVR